MKILNELARTRRSTLLIGDTGAGKSVTQAYLLNKMFEFYPDASVFVLSQKMDSFCGLAETGKVLLFNPKDLEPTIKLIEDIWKEYDRRRRLPETDRQELSPVRLVLADWLSINQALDSMKNDESIKSSQYLPKLADIIYNGRELNVALIVDLQSYNLSAVGLKADRNSRKNFNLLGLGNYSVDAQGLVNDSYGVLINLIGDHHIVSEDSERIVLSQSFKSMHPYSKVNCRPIVFSGGVPAKIGLLPDLRKYKSKSIKPRQESVSQERIKQGLERLLGSSIPEPDAKPLNQATDEGSKGLSDGSQLGSESEPLNHGLEPLNQPISEGSENLNDGSQLGSERFTPLNLTKEQVLGLISELNRELNQTQVIERLWQVRKGGSAAWRAAKEQFNKLTEGE